MLSVEFSDEEQFSRDRTSLLIMILIKHSAVEKILSVNFSIEGETQSEMNAQNDLLRHQKETHYQSSVTP